MNIVDEVREDLKTIAGKVAPEDRALLEDHVSLIADLEKELSQPDQTGNLAHPMPDIDPKIELVNDNTPRISRIQIDLMINAMANDMTRIATLQYHAISRAGADALARRR